MELIRIHGEDEIKRRGESIQPDDLATIIYTSGTTGIPKGVMLTHRNFCWEIYQIQLVFPISELDRVVIFLPPWHIAERVLELTLIACGASMANSNIMLLATHLQIIKLTFLVSVPLEIRLSSNPFIQQVVVVGQDEKTLGALIYPNLERVKEELKKKNISLPDNVEAWNGISQVQQLFNDIIKNEVSANHGFKSFERVTTFYLIPEELKKGVEMTETMKVKRNVVHSKYEKIIKKMFAN